MDEHVLVQIYGLMLRLYPDEFRQRRSDEMRSALAQAVAGARREGRPTTGAILRELIRFPGNLLMAYARSWQRLEPELFGVPDWSWVARWVLFNTMALPMAWLLAAPVGVLFLSFFSLTGSIRFARPSSTMILLGFVAGLGFTSSGLQWVLLRRHLRRANWWIPVSLAGWLGAGLLVFALDFLFEAWLLVPLPMVAMVALLGASVGVAQWFLLRRLLPHAGWWPPANLVAFGTLLLAGNSFSSFADLMETLTLPHVVTGTLLWMLLQRAPAAARPTLPGRKSGRSRAVTWPVHAAFGLFFLLLLAIGGPWVYTTSQLHLAKRDGIYASPAEGLRIRAAAVQGAQLLRIEELESGLAWGDGRLPHVGFAVGRVSYDRPPTGWRQSSNYWGHYYIRVREGWVRMPRSAYPNFIGQMIEIYGLEGAGEEQFWQARLRTVVGDLTKGGRDG